MPDQPDLLIVVPDQWRGDAVGHMGDPAAHTPNLDALAAEGVSFRNAFCQNPVCTPSRCSFLTGWYPHVRGHRTMRHMLQPHEPMLLRDLKAAGYRVWWGGKNDAVAAQYGYGAYCDVRYEPPSTPERPLRPNLHSYHSWRGDPESDAFYSFYNGPLPDSADTPFVYDFDQGIVEGACAYLTEAPRDRPLCLFLSLRHPHPPFVVEQYWYDRIDQGRLPPRIAAPPGWPGKPRMLPGLHERQRMQSWDEPRWDALRATYYGMCARVDAQLGLLLDALRASGRYDRTAVICFSDHGEFAGDYGLVEKTQNTFEDYLTRVPFVIKPPAGVAVQPRVSEALVELLDLPATVADLAGITLGHSQFGRSLLPVVAGERDGHRDAVFCEGGRLPGETQAMELDSPQEEAWLYWPRMSLQHDDVAHGKATMCRTRDYKYVHRLMEPDELYDLHADPHELHNRIDDPALAEVRDRLKERLLRFYLTTADVVPHAADQRD